jgi:hypothetical protein
MGTVHKFRRPPKNKDQFRGYTPSPEPDGPKGPKRPRRKWGLIHSLLTLIGVAVALYCVFSPVPAHSQIIIGRATAVDGDTRALTGSRIRLFGIDALPPKPPSLVFRADPVFIANNRTLSPTAALP